MNTDIDHLRITHRRARAELGEGVQATNSEGLCKNISQQPEFLHAVNIAAYIAIRGEIDTSLLMAAAESSEKNFYLPVLRGEKMFFAPWKPGETLLKKGFGLLEPESDEWIEPDQIDVVLAPLVVFDNNCNRIGQGGGYYDRTFAHKKPDRHNRPVCAKPFLLGVAHESQRESQLQPQPWDVPLDMVATESSIYRRKH